MRSACWTYKLLIPERASHARLFPIEGAVVHQVKAGDTVLYFKWAGDSMETPDGQKFVVVHESDILCKV